MSNTDQSAPPLMLDPWGDEAAHRAANVLGLDEPVRVFFVSLDIDWIDLDALEGKASEEPLAESLSAGDVLETLREQQVRVQLPRGFVCIGVIDDHGHHHYAVISLAATPEPSRVVGTT